MANKESRFEIGRFVNGGFEPPLFSDGGQFDPLLLIRVKRSRELLRLRISSGHFFAKKVSDRKALSRWFQARDELLETIRKQIVA